MPSYISQPATRLTSEERDAWIDELSKLPNPSPEQQQLIIWASICQDLRRIADVLEDVHDTNNSRIKTRGFVDVIL